jgi:uncharacterized protein YvpB
MAARLASQADSKELASRGNTQRWIMKILRCMVCVALIAVSAAILAIAPRGAVNQKQNQKTQVFGKIETVYFPELQAKVKPLSLIEDPAAPAQAPWALYQASPTPIAPTATPTPISTPTPTPAPTPAYMDLLEYIPYDNIVGSPIEQDFSEDSGAEPWNQTFAEALANAKAQGANALYWKKSDSFIWNGSADLPDSRTTNAPLIYQMPELPRGCEVTSLAMLLNAHGIGATKMGLADEIAKVGFPGDPNTGFVGNMYNFSKSGYGVYHSPIYNLLTNYTDLALDITGCDFDDLLYFLGNGMPVWVVTNSTYRELPSSEFRYWNLDTGTIRITYRDHSVLAVGYDQNYIYINDPLGSADWVTRENFRKAWVQMGSQAVTIVKPVGSLLSAPTLVSEQTDYRG